MKDQRPKTKDRRPAVYAAILILFVLELTVLNKFKLFGAKPDMLLIATIFFGFHFGVGRGIEVGLVSGALEDLAGGAAFGINIFSLLVIGFLSGYLRKTLYKENFVIQFLFSNIFVYLKSFIYFLYIGGALEPVLYPRFWLIVLYKGLYTGALTPFLFYIFARFYGSSEPEII